MSISTNYNNLFVNFPLEILRCLHRISHDFIEQSNGEHHLLLHAVFADIFDVNTDLLQFPCATCIRPT